MSDEPTELDDILPEYDLRGARPSPYAERFYKQYGLIQVDPDVAEIFPDTESVRGALRAVTEIIRLREERKTQTSG